MKRKKVGKITYYYLQHSVRKGSKVQSKEIYLGRKIPKNIEEIKGKLLKTIYEKEWYPLLDRIKEKYSKEIKLMPRSSREKQMAIFASRFTYNTQRIEGSKLTLKETANLLEKGITPKRQAAWKTSKRQKHTRGCSMPRY